MFIQEIIVAIILLATLVITIIRLVRFFANPLSKCKGCDRACGECSLVELKRQVRSQKSEVKSQKSEVRRQVRR